jgi:hypothetical protein
MKATTFDALARILANRLPRRRALHQGGPPLLPERAGPPHSVV